jgi:hypothetical protein
VFVHDEQQYWAHNSGDIHILRVDGWLMVALAKHPLAENQANRRNR